MTAIVEIGAKQYLVSEKSEIYVEKLNNKVGETVKLDKVLMVNNKVGSPYIKGAYVECEVKKHGQHEKITVIHHIPQKHHNRKYGHRQPYTKLIVKSIKE